MVQSSSSAEALYAEYQRQRAEFTDLKRRIESVTVTVVSPRREVSVTMGAQGVLTELKFLTSAYKMLAPAELATLLMDTVRKARSQVNERTVEIMAPMLPPGLDTKKLLSGNIDGTEFLPDELSHHPLVEEQLRKWS